MKKIFFITLVSLLFIPFMSIQAKEVIVKEDIMNGTITVDKNEAEEGEIVTIKVVPNEGYDLKILKALDKFDEMPVVITNNSFVMPSYNVFISAEFEKNDEYVEPYNTTTTGINPSELEEPSENNNIIYVIGGVGALLVGTFVIIIVKKKNRSLTK